MSIVWTKDEVDALVKRLKAYIRAGHSYSRVQPSNGCLKSPKQRLSPCHGPISWSGSDTVMVYTGLMGKQAPEWQYSWSISTAIKERRKLCRNFQDRCSLSRYFFLLEQWHSRAKIAVWSPSLPTISDSPSSTGTCPSDIPWRTCYATRPATERCARLSTACLVTTPFTGCSAAVGWYAVSSNETFACLFMDGLDEFEGNDDQNDRQYLSELFRSFVSAPSIRICSSSRPLLILKKSFRISPTRSDVWRYDAFCNGPFV